MFANSLWLTIALAASAAAIPAAGSAQRAPAASVVPMAAAAPHERLLPLQGGRNFRDLGGYGTVDGRHVRWGLLFRSGSMHGLTDRDYAYLERRGIRVVCDFRDTNERAAEPVNWPGGGAPRVLSDDYRLDMAGFMPAGDMKNWTPDQARATMTASYPRLLVQFHDQYRRMFAELLAGHAPLAFNCSAGKDRTGVAAALLLTALGVPRPTVIDDYLLTNRYLDARTLVSKDATPTAANPLAKVPPAVAQALVAADRNYIEAALAVLDTHPGGAQAWLRDEMGLSAASTARLRQMYLQ